MFLQRDYNFQGNERDAKMQTRVKWLEPSVRRDDWKDEAETGGGKK